VVLSLAVNKPMKKELCGIADNTYSSAQLDEDNGTPQLKQTSTAD
jgi:hypothetical protein